MNIYDFSVKYNKGNAILDFPGSQFAFQAPETLEKRIEEVQ